MGCTSSKSKTTKEMYEDAKIAQEAAKQPESHSQKMLKEANEMFNNGNLLFRDHSYSEARAKYTEALERLRDHDGLHQQTHKSLALSNLGVLEFADGRFEEAKALILAALEERKKISTSPEDKSTLPSVTALSLELKRDIDFHRLSSGKRGLAAQLRDHATVDAMTADLMNNLAACHEVAGELEQAKALYEESLILRKLIFGAKSSKVAESMHNLATVLDSQGKHVEAQRLLEEALLIEEVVHGEGSVDTGVSLNNLGVLCAHVGDLEKAETYLRRAVLIRKKHYGVENHMTKAAQQNLEYVINKGKEGVKGAEDADKSEMNQV